MRILMGAESRRRAFSAAFARMAFSAVGSTVTELAQGRKLRQLVPALASYREWARWPVASLAPSRGRKAYRIHSTSERPLPETTLKLLRPLAAALAPKTATLRASGRLDLPALARLFVYLGSLRDPNEIAALASASFARVLRLQASQVWMWDEVGRPVELASWVSDPGEVPLVAEELDTARSLVDPALVHQLVDVRGPRGKKRRGGPVIWLPLRANGEDIGQGLRQFLETLLCEVRCGAPKDVREEPPAPTSAKPAPRRGRKKPSH